MKKAFSQGTGLLALTGVLSVLSPAGSPLSAAPPSPGGPKIACDAVSIKAPADTTITSVRAIDAPVKYCRVDGFVTTTNPGPNKVGFMIAMPDRWNGRYYLQVPGGAGGTIGPPQPKYLNAGYAYATTDKGSPAQGTVDFSFLSNPAQSTDYIHRGTHVSAVASQALARSYYGSALNHRYIAGCSAGGRGTTMEAEWYPQDAEAFIAGSVGYSRPGSPNLTGYMAQTIFRDPQRWISPAEMKRVADIIMKEYDPSDGAVDGLIWDPTKIVLRHDLFPFLSDKQFAMLRLLNEGFEKARGYWVGNPVPLAAAYLGTSSPPWTSQTQPNQLKMTDSVARAQNGQNYNVLTDMDYSKPASGENVKPAPGTLGPGNLKPVQKTGGKIVMWTGAADTSITPQSVVDYADEVTRLYGAKRTTWFRTFFAPGMYHCLGGEGQPTNLPDVMLHAAEAWVEQGKAPDFVIASNVEISRTYKLCSYPRTAMFKGGVKNPGKLDVKDANNWTCTGTMNAYQKLAAR